MNAKYFKMTLGLALCLLPGAGLRADHDYGNMTQAETTCLGKEEGDGA
jgi:hypothetical protein